MGICSIDSSLDCIFFHDLGTYICILSYIFLILVLVITCIYHDLLLKLSTALLILLVVFRFQALPPLDNSRNDVNTNTSTVYFSCIQNP
jgi:hypothetical protein